MKKLLTLAFTLLLATSLSFAQAGGSTADKTAAGKKSTVKSTGKASSSSKVELNPQPLPPKTEKGRASSPGEKVTLNPQPLPPKVANSQTVSPQSKVALNPQPLPPKETASKKKGTVGTEKSKKGSGGTTGTPSPK